MTAAGTERTSRTSQYVVLERDHTDLEAWKLRGTVRATTAASAIREIVGDAAKEPRTLVAIPARSFKPVTAQAHTRTTVTLTA